MSLAMVLLSYCYGITYALYDQHFSTITVAILFFITISMAISGPDSLEVPTIYGWPIFQG